MVGTGVASFSVGAAVGFLVGLLEGFLVGLAVGGLVSSALVGADVTGAVVEGLEVGAAVGARDTVSVLSLHSPSPLQRASPMTPLLFSHAYFALQESRPILSALL